MITAVYYNMWLKSLCAIGAVLCIQISLSAQPPPCIDPAAMTSYCEDACIICDIDGFEGENNSTDQGQAPSGFCTLIEHNIQWIAFIAGSEDLTLSLDVGMCCCADTSQSGIPLSPGLEVGIYEGTDCNEYDLVTECNTSILEFSSATFSNTVPLTIGQFYYFVMDGNAGAICDYTINVVEGSTQVDPIDFTGPVYGTFFSCPNAIDEFSTETVSSATLYNWTVNGDFLGEGLSISYQWPAPGTYDICVQSFNACDFAPPSCQTVLVSTIDDTILPDLNLCPNECDIINGDTLCTTGVYSWTLLSSLGCDSTVTINVEERDPTTIDLDYQICDGDTFTVGSSNYTSAGTFSNVLETQFGCDSTVNLILQTVYCNLEATLSISDVSCYNASDGSIEFELTNGYPPFDYEWELISDPNIAGTGTISSINSSETLSGLSGGLYILTVTDAYGDIFIDVVSILEPTSLLLSSELSTYNNYEIDCFGENSGWIELDLVGGTQPYNYLWSNSSSDEDQDALTAGIYSVLISDMNGCMLMDTFELSQPIEFIYTAGSIDPTCEGINTGIIQTTNLTGGVPNYEFILNGESFGNNTILSDLSPGSYTLEVTDANGCIQTYNTLLANPEIPEPNAGEDETIDLGNSTSLIGSYNEYDITAESIEWFPTIGLECPNCLSTTAIPYNDQNYTLSITSSEGCVRSDDIFITVNKDRQIHIPNAFSPNGDGQNDSFFVNSNQAVDVISFFGIYNRWGQLIHKGNNIPANDPAYGWDGLSNGKTQALGTYVYVAEILFLDGERLPYKGNVTLIR